MADSVGEIALDLTLDLDDLNESMSDTAKNVDDKLNKQFSSAAKICEDKTDEIAKSVKKSSEKISESTDEAFEKIRRNSKSTSEKAKEDVDETTEKIKPTIEELKDSIIKSFEETESKVKPLITNITDEIRSSFDKINAAIEKTGSELQSIDSLLDYDSSNAVLLAQKHEILSQSVENAKRKLEALNATKDRMNSDFEAGEIGEEDFRAYQREIIKAEQELKKAEEALSDFSNASTEETQKAEESMESLVEQTKITSKEIQKDSQKISDSVEQTFFELPNTVQKASDEVSTTLSKLPDTAQKASDKIASSFGKIGKALVAAFSVKAVIAFGRQAAEAAASVKASNSQMAQTFGELEDSAKAAIQSVADDSKILDTRLQGVGTSIYAFAKTSGMGSANALNMMKDALQVTADSAAYYDRSLEDTAESLKSFLKGNFENDAALGLSCTETTRNAAANKLYGKSFKDLSEAQKQLTLLQMVKDANKLSGALGQAARESDGWENVLGNLKESWRQLLAVIGQPIMQAAVSVIQRITAALQVMTKYAQAAVSAFSQLFGGQSDTEQAVASAAASAADMANSTADSSQGMNDTATAANKVKRAVAGFDKLNVLSGDDSSDSSAASSDTPASIPAGSSSVGDAKENLTLLDKLQNKLSELKALTVKGFWAGLGDTSVFKSIQKEISGISSGFKKIATDSNVMNSVSGYFNSMAFNLGKVSGSAVSVGSTIVDNIFGGLEKYISQNGEYLKERIISIFDVGGGIWDTVGNVSAAFADVFSVFRSDDAKQITADIIAVFSNGFFGAVDLAQRLAADILSCITTPFTDNKDAIKSALEGILAPIQSIIGSISGVVTNTFNTIFAAYDQYIKPAFDNITSGLNTIVEAVTSAFNTYFLPVFNNIATGFSDMMSNHVQPLIDSIVGFCGRVIEYVSLVWDYISPFLGWVAGNLVSGISTALNTIWNIVSPIINYILDILSNLFDALSGILDFVIGIFTGDWERAWSGIKKVVSSVFDNFRALFDMAKGILLGIVKSLVTGISNNISNCVDGVKTFFSSAYERIIAVWNGITGFFSGVWNGIKNVFGGVADWFRNIFSEAWAKVKGVFSTGGKIFSGIVDGIADTFKNIVNKIIGGINKVIAVPFNTINDMLKKLKEIKILGLSPFSWVKEFKVPQIPKLAQGGYVKANTPQLAMIGDNKRYGEIVAPEDKIEQMILKALVLYESRHGSTASSGGSSQQLIELVINIGGKTLLREIIKLLQDEERRSGSYSFSF